MIHYTFLTKDQIFGSSTCKQSAIFKKRGTKAAISDYSILLGGYVSNRFYLDDDQKLEKRTGWYWTKTAVKDNHVNVVSPSGENCVGNLFNRYVGIRLAAPYSEIIAVAKNKTKAIDGIVEMNHGILLNRIASLNMQQILEEKYKNHTLKISKKFYVTDCRKYNEYIKNLKIQKQIIAEYKGKNFARIKANPYYNEFNLPNDYSHRNGDYVWFPLSHIKWWGCEEDNIAVTKDIIFAGIQFNNKAYYDGNFEQTDIYKFMNQYLLQDMFNFKDDEIDVEESVINLEPKKTTNNEIKLGIKMI